MVEGFGGSVGTLERISMQCLPLKQNGAISTVNALLSFYG
jgi:hypothetical protein